jgi:hypothetical protein
MSLLPQDCVATVSLLIKLKLFKHMSQPFVFREKPGKVHKRTASRAVADSNKASDHFEENGM